MAEKIAVTTGGLAKKQGEWVDWMRQIETCFTEMGKALNNLDQNFSGGPVNKIKNKGLKRQENGMACVKQLKMHLEKLSEIKAVYNQAERSNQGAITDN